MFSMDDLKTKLRESKLGGIATSKFSEAQAEEAISSAIREYSKHRPIKQLDSLTTVKSQANYDLSGKSGIIRVKEVYYNTSGSEWWFEAGWPGVVDPLTFEGMGSLEGISIFENPSIWTQWISRLEAYKRIFEGDFEWDMSGKILTLIPAPSTDGNIVPYIYTAMHQPGTIPDIDVDLVLMWAEAYGKDIVASRQISEIRSVSGFGQSISFGVSARELQTSANELRKEFRRKLGGVPIQVG